MDLKNNIKITVITATLNSDKFITSLAKSIKNQTDIIYDLEKKISNYLSLGYKTTKSNILKEIKITEGYRLAFCLAIGDGIEADSHKQSAVKWAELSNDNNIPLPKGITPISKYIKGSKKLEKFLAQVGIVKNNDECYRYQKSLKNGQKS